MSSYNAADRSQLLCQHIEHRTGCLACSLHEAKIELSDTSKSAQQWKTASEDNEALMKQIGLRARDLEHYKAQHEEALDMYKQCQVRLDEQQETIELFEQQIETLCRGKEPSELADILEDAAGDLHEEWVMLLHNTSDAGILQLPCFVEEDPDLKQPYTELDRSSIPATPDAYVMHGLGLEMYLRKGYADKKELSANATGDTTMSFGSALRMFGPPELTTSSRLASLMWRTSISKPEDVETPKTEQEFRASASQAGSTPLLTPDEQWKLFAPNKLLGHIANVARLYAKLVREKERKKPGQSSSESVPEGTIAWPEVEKLDWNGFTNWVSRCKKVNKKFGTAVVLPWFEETQKRRIEVVELLAANKLAGDAAYGLTDDPSAFYDGKKSLAEIDCERLGMSVKATHRE